MGVMVLPKKTLFKIIKIAGVVLIAGVILVIINAFTGNPISKSNAKNKIESYLQSVYSKDIKVEKTYYDFYGGWYISHANINGESRYFKYSANRIWDDNVIDYFDDKLNKDYNSVCQAIKENTHLEFPYQIGVSTMVIADGKYSADFESLNVEQKIYLLGFRNHDKMLSENDSKNMASRIASQFIDILGDRYNFNSIQMNYTDKYGAYEIIIKDKTLTLDELLRHTRKLKDSELAEEDRAFIKNLNS